MKKRIRIKAMNGMTVDFRLKDVTGYTTTLMDSKIFDVILTGDNKIPIHPDSEKQFINFLYPG